MNKLHKMVTEDALNPGFLLAIEPVYNRNLEVVAFQLLLDKEQNHLNDEEELDNLSQLVMDTYGSLHKGGKSQTVPVFLDISEKLLSTLETREISPEQYILQVSATIPLTPEYLNTLKNLSNKGFRIALTNYLSNPDLSSQLLEIVHLVKFGGKEADQDSLQQVIETIKPYGLEVMIEGLPSRTEFVVYHQIGCHLFCGNFFDKPEHGGHKELGSNKMLLVELLTELQNPNTNIKRLEEIAIKDAKLTYKLLKIINSAAFGLSKEIESLSHAINILGTDQLGRWVTLFLLEGNKNSNSDLMRNMLVRGRMSEILAELAGRGGTTSHFIAGLLTQLDVMMEIPMEDLMQQVPLKQEIKDALLERAGSIGEILNEVEHYETGEFDKLHVIADKNFYEVAYRHSNSWAKQILSVLSR